VQVLLLLALIVPVLVFAITAWNTRSYSEAEQADIQVQVDRATQGAQEQLQHCLDNPEDEGVPPGDDVQQTCEDWYLPQAQWYGGRQPLDLVNERENGSGPVVITLLVVLALLAATTFAGHDWSTGSMSNQLLFEPRRGRLWLAKGLVVMLATAIVCVAVLAAYWTGLWVLAQARGLDPSSGSLGKGYKQGLRGTALAALGALAVYAVTMLFRSTVVTLGVLFGLSILTPILMALIAFPDNERWMPQTNVAAVILDGTTYYGEMSCTTTTDELGNEMQECGDSTEHRLSLAGGSAYLLGLLALAAVPSAASFRRRDVP